jgi:hypothetical protein
MIRIPLKKTMVQANFDTSELSPIEIINEEECDRVTQIQSRGYLLKALGVVDFVYR